VPRLVVNAVDADAFGRLLSMAPFAVPLPG